MNERDVAMMRVTEAMGAGRLLRVVQSMVADEPGVAGHTVLARLELEVAAMEAQAEGAVTASAPARTECAKCGAPIETRAGDRSTWIHSSDGSRGCRAATFDNGAEQAWNDSIPRSWMATPKRRV